LDKYFYHVDKGINFSLQLFGFIKALFVLFFKYK